MRRILLAVIGFYLAVAVGTRLVEASGSDRLSCGCNPECWCKRPGISLFRWVTPRRTHHLGSAHDKEMAEA